MLVWFIRQKRRTIEPFFPQMKILHLYFWKKKHKYCTMGGAICGKIGGEKAWLRKRSGNGKKMIKKKTGKKMKKVGKKRSGK
jgi:hypothetical protein